MKQPLPFVKMHGLGNDFVVVDARSGATPAHNWPTLAQAMCDRHYGVGADQLLLVCDSRRADVTMRLFNTDGFEAEMCGNGIRCVGKYVYERGIVRKPQLAVETLGGVKRLNLLIEHGIVSGAAVAMGVPQAVWLDEPVIIDGVPLRLMSVNVGNPHAVAVIETPVENFPLERIGPQVERHPLFPNRTNFEVINVLQRDPPALQARVWERSAGLTLACGTGACAVTVAARLQGLVGNETDVHLPGGTLRIAWDGEDEVWMTGPATTVFEGVW
ncbi:MAG: diaminopimelate epimerase, partial [Chloroflexi bacterium]|nr:diaminopimelate epimerase [Chloroflexota bacterium]